MSRLGKQITRFLFPARSSRWIGLLRIGLGLQVTIYCLSLWPDWNTLFTANGDNVINRELTESLLNLDSRFIPRFGWLVSWGTQMGLSETVTLRVILASLLGSGLFLLAGFFSRPAAILAWLLHLAARTSGGFTAYGVDNFMTIGLFYLMLCPLPDCYSIDWRLKNRRGPDPRMVGFYQRLLQFHVCLIYFFAGLAKCLGSGWWNGDSIWRALTRSPFNVVSADLLLRWSGALPLLGISICLLEASYPFLVWPRKTRAIWYFSIIAVHLGIALTMGLYLFALIMIILNVAAFGADLPPFSKPCRARTPG
jgi:hypothetical protein